MKKRIFFLMVFFAFAASSVLWAGGAEEKSEAVAAKAAKEAPKLAELVAAGKLPPLEERLPEEPMVLKPVGGGEIGEYGGTLRLGSVKTARSVEASGIANWPTLIALDTDMATFLPNLAKEFTYSEDMKIFTFTLRKGLKWSDGHPFTTEDVQFWYEDCLLNKEFVPAQHDDWTPGGELLKLEVVDELTFRFKSAVTYPIALYVFAKPARPWHTPYLPKHYLKDYHPNYVTKDDLEKRAKDAGYDDWVKYFKTRTPTHFYDLRYAVGHPTMAAYNLTQKGTGVFLLERNPYYWKVDQEGNQLPYIDRLQVINVKNKEVLMTKILNGELEYARYNLSMEDYPLLVENQERGKYLFYDEWRQAYNTAHTIRFNLTHNDPVIRKLFQDFRFRRAMSIALDRKEMNEVLFFGAGVPMQNTVMPRTSKYFVDKNAFSHIEYDPKEANRLLDEIGLKWDANHQWRLRPDGKPLVLVHICQIVRPHLPPALELTTEYWREVGVNVIPKPVDNTLWNLMGNNNEFDMSMYSATGVEPRIIALPANFVPIEPANHWGNQWYHWYASGGKKGEAPPPKIQRLFDLYEIMKTDPNPANREKAIKEMLKSSTENLWSLGTLGLYPQLAVANKNMVNVPREPVTAVWDTRHDSIANPETWFYRGGQPAQ